MTVEIELVPTPRKPGRFDVLADGAVLLLNARTPFLTAARKLRDRGHAPEELLIARHRGQRGVALQAAIGAAAKWSVSDGDRTGLHRQPWHPFDAHHLRERDA